MTKRCPVCREQIVSKYRRTYCSKHCRYYQAPAVYRFVCPDGRSYVGSTPDHHKRLRSGFDRNNRRLAIALEHYPEEQWTFEILQLLPPACPVLELRRAEQRHIEQLQTLSPEHGFNIHPALYSLSKDIRIIFLTDTTITATEVTDTAI